MKLIYLVYREDNVMVYESQVLEYLRSLKQKRLFDSIELIVFRHEQNLTRKVEVETRILRYVGRATTFWSFPVLTMAQLNANALRLKRYAKQAYAGDDRIAVICRGDLAAYVGVRAFRDFPNSRLLYDNRGLAYEESLMSHGDNIIHRLNRLAKRKALMRACRHCDMYNFVTSAMRQYFLERYDYDPELPYTIIPTLYRAEPGTDEAFAEIASRERVKPTDFVISYVGSAAAWQATERLIGFIGQIGSAYPEARFFLLSNGTIPGLDRLPRPIRNRITAKRVPHDEIKYYLRMTRVGIVLRDNNIVNRVAAPTKIAEYLNNGVTLLYSGTIGVIDDLKGITDGGQMICVDTDENWLDRINPDQCPARRIDPAVVDYFDMDKRQLETHEMITRAFASEKVR